MPINLGIKDKKILYELDINARQSNNKIAKKVRLSKDVVGYRIKKLEEAGVIRNYLTVFDTTKLGFTCYRFHLKFWGTTASVEKQILDYLKPRIFWAATTRGQWDINFILWAKNIYELNEFWHDFYSKFGAYIQESWFSVFTRIVHYPRGFLLGVAPKTSLSVGGSLKSVKIDKIDYKLLEELAVNARASNIEIAKKLSATEIVVRYRIKKLLKEGIILGFRPALDINLLGYKYYKVYFFLRNISKDILQQMKAFMQARPAIAYLDETIGGADLEVELYVRDTEELYALIEEFRQRFADYVKGFEFLEYAREHTMKYLP